MAACAAALGRLTIRPSPWPQIPPRRSSPPTDTADGVTLTPVTRVFDGPQAAGAGLNVASPVVAAGGIAAAALTAALTDLLRRPLTPCASRRARHVRPSLAVCRGHGRNRRNPLLGHRPNRREVLIPSASSIGARRQCRNRRSLDPLRVVALLVRNDENCDDAGEHSDHRSVLLSLVERCRERAR